MGLFSFLSDGEGPSRGLRTTILGIVLDLAISCANDDDAFLDKPSGIEAVSRAELS